MTRKLNYFGVIILISFIFSACVSSNNKCRGVIEHYNLGSKVNTPNNKKVVLVGGCFDIIHFGHIYFLEQARKSGDYLIVALEPDSRILSKRSKVTHNQMQRAIMLTPYADMVLLLDTLKGYNDYNQLVRDINPSVIVVTSDDPQMNNKTLHAKSIGARLNIVTDRIGDLSSSKIYKDQEVKNAK